MSDDPEKQVTFILVEDDELDAEVFNRRLKKHGINRETRLARNGQEALDLLRKEFKTSPLGHIVFLDLNMPGINGHEFLAMLRDDEDLKATIVFVLTTSDHERDVRLAYEQNVAGYFTKTRIDDLIEAIKPYARGVELPIR